MSAASPGTAASPRVDVPRTIPEMLAAAGRARGAQPAVLFPDTGAELSHAQLEERVRAVAAQLAGRGLASGDAVALLLDNGRAMVELFLAVPSAAMVCVPLNPHAGAAQIRYMLVHSGARLAVCEPAYRALLEEAAAGLEVAVEEADGGAPVALGEGRGVPPAPAAGSDAVIDYTSGTTGNPKGVVVDHAILMANARAHVEGHALGPGDRALLVLPLHHMNAQGVTLLSSLYAGASVVVPREFTPESFWRLVADYGCTWFALVPSLVASLVRFGEARPQLTPDVSRVRFARSSSAPLPAELHEAFEERYGVHLIECMGMTEAGPVFINPLPPAPARRGSVGRPAGCEARVVDEARAVLPPGREGRIEVRGPCIMKRYHDDAEATARAIGDDGWLVTGDIGYRDTEGFYYIRGRESDRINKGGEKISLREVDEALAAFAGVAEAAAVGFADPVFGQDVAGFVVAAPGCRIDERALRRHCESRLGTFLCPTYLYVVDGLPRGATGKVRRRELAARVERRRAERAPAPDAPAAGGGPGIEPRNLTERVVAELWKEALELESIGVHDDFFDLGGNSHKAIRLCYRVKEAFDIDFPVSELFEASTVAAMAALLDRQRDRSVEQGPGGGRPSLITLSEIGAREPAYFIPGGTGDENIILFLYGKITHHLGAERPVLAFRAPGLDGRGAPPGRIEALAEAYIEEMRRRQPAGPYYLVGFCIGGLLAFEIARRLRGSGDDVGVLALVDTAFPGIGRVLRNRTRGVVKFVNRNLRFLTRGLWGRAGVHLARVRELGAREAPAYLLSKLYGLGRYYDHATRPAMRLHPDREVARRIGRGQAAYQRSLLAYRAQPYDGEIQVFVSGGERELRGERWRAVARGGLQLHEVPGDHYTHCREFADDLAARLGACLDAGPGGR